MNYKDQISPNPPAIPLHFTRSPGRWTTFINAFSCLNNPFILLILI